MKDDEQLLVGLDIGTTKICVVVGKTSDDNVNIVGTVPPRQRAAQGIVVIWTAPSIPSRRPSRKRNSCRIQIDSCLAGIAGPI